MALAEMETDCCFQNIIGQRDQSNFKDLEFCSLLQGFCDPLCNGEQLGCVHQLTSCG